LLIYFILSFYTRGSL